MSLGRQRLRLALALLLCASTWRGPLPVLHNHGIPGLAALHHLESGHGSDGKAVSGWHWHFALPGDIADLPDGQAPIETEIVVLACAGELQEFSILPELRCDFGPAPDPLRVQTGRLHQSCPGRGIAQNAAGGDLLSRLPLKAVTGVCVV